LGGLSLLPPRRGTLANHRAAVALSQRHQDGGLQVDSLLACGLRGLTGYQGLGNFQRRHRGLRPPQHTPKQRPALEPWIALVASFRADGPNVKAGLEHLQHGFNLYHGRLDLDASVPVFREFPRQFGV
jgi:hypothetical protein